MFPPPSFFWFSGEPHPRICGRQLAAHFIKGGSTADNFLDRIKTAFYNLINNYKNDATLKCLYQHIKEKENMVVALALPFGASVECMQVCVFVCVSCCC